MKKILIVIVLLMLFIYSININVKGIKGRHYVEKYLNKFTVLIFNFAFIFVINNMDAIITLIIVGIAIFIAFIDSRRKFRLMIYNSEGDEIRECIMRILDRKSMKFREDYIGKITVGNLDSTIEIEEDGIVTSYVKVKFSRNEKMRLIRDELIENTKNVQDPVCKYRNGSIFDIVIMSIIFGVLGAIVIKTPYI